MIDHVLQFLSALLWDLLRTLLLFFLFTATLKAMFKGGK